MNDSGSSVELAVFGLVLIYFIYKLIEQVLWILFYTPVGHLLIFLVVVAVLIAKHERLLFLLYSITPHPAARMVNRAICRGEPIDGELYAEVAEPFFDNRFKEAARTAQAAALTRRLREHEAVQRAREARQAERVRRKVQRESAAIRAHTDLLRAGVEHETAVVRLDEYRRSR